jgi:putative transposase
MLGITPSILFGDPPMAFVLQPWYLLLAILAGWVNREQQEAIEYLRTENQVLREKLGTKRILLDDDQRRRLAVKGKVLGWKRLKEVAGLFTPDTILRWHRELIAEKWDYSDRNPEPLGRPPVSDEVRQIVLQMARENPSWGYDRIQGAVVNLGHAICDQTVGNILKENGIEPAPERKRQTSASTWATFLKSHWDVLGALDFTTVEVWTKSGLVTHYLLFVMKVATRNVHFAGCTTRPNALWMQQVARNLTDCCDGFLLGIRYLLMDRDSTFCAAFRSILESGGVEPVRLPPKSPNLNSHLERFHLSLKSECAERMIFFGETMLRNAVREYLVHYHSERNHQGLENRILTPGEEVGRVAGTIQCRERLGGLLKYYHREAA